MPRTLQTYREVVPRPGFDDTGMETMSVRSVSRERWLEAQAWERDLWVTSQQRRGWRRLAWPVVRPILRAGGWHRAWGDDWNHWWANQFEHYRFLPADLGDYIEVGCGPYTNTRVILSGRTADRVVCSDPLVETYLTFRDRWLATAHRAGRLETDAHPIEELPFAAESFDTLVMINVLDHVRDADRCLEVVTGLLRPGGTLVLGQDLSDADDVRRHPRTSGTRSGSQWRTWTATSPASSRSCARASPAMRDASRGFTTAHWSTPESRRQRAG